MPLSLSWTRYYWGLLSGARTVRPDTSVLDVIFAWMIPSVSPL